MDDKKRTNLYKLLCNAKTTETSIDRLCRDYNQLLSSRRCQSTATAPLCRHPERILDAPNLADDFYTNNVDWGNRGHLGIGLGESVYLWRADEPVVELAGEGGLVGSVAFIHDGTMLAVGRADGRVQIWSVSEQSVDRVNALSWNKHVLTAATKSGHVVTMDIRLPLSQCKSWSRLSSNGEEVCGVKWSWEGDSLAVGSNDNNVQILDNSGACKFTLEHHNAAVKALAWCPYQSGVLATGGGTACQQLALWCTRSGRLLDAKPTGAQISGITWDRQGSRQLATVHGFPLNNIQLWRHHRHSLDSHSSACIDNAHDQRILHGAISPLDNTVVTAGADESIKFWRLFENGGGDGEADGKGKVMLPKLLPSFAKNKRHQGPDHHHHASVKKIIKPK